MSDDTSSTSPGGSPIYRHREAQGGSRPAAESKGMEEVEAHFTRHFGEPTDVFHEIVSHIVHLDVHLIPPRPERDCWTLFTTGMSDLPMNVPDGAEDFRFAELYITLPTSWPMDKLRVSPPPTDLEEAYWPIRWLKQLARLPHQYNTWLGFGHTIPNGDPPSPFTSATKLCGWILLPPVFAGTEARSFTRSDGNTVHIYGMNALHIEEMNLKLNKGTDALLDVFERAKVEEVLRIDRKPAQRRKLFGLF